MPSVAKKTLLNFAALPMMEMWLMNNRRKELNVSLFDKWVLISFSPAEMYRIQIFFFFSSVGRYLGKIVLNLFLNKYISHAYVVMEYNVKIPGSC